MGKPQPVALRKRVVDFVAEGNAHRSAAAKLRVSVKFVNDRVERRRPPRKPDAGPALPCDVVFAAGQRQVEVIGPMLEAEADAVPAGNLGLAFRTPSHVIALPHHAANALLHPGCRNLVILVLIEQAAPTRAADHVAIFEQGESLFDMA